MAEHWNDDELMERLYGLGPEDGHLRECAACGARWRALLQARGRVLEPPPIAEELLAAQRRAIYTRLEQPVSRRGWFSFAPAAVATAAVLLLAVLLRGPAPRTNSEPSDTELFADVFVLAQGTEPQAVEPIHALFEVDQ